VSALISKPGITRLATSSGVPKEWSQSWFRDFISDYMKLADARNALGANGITVSGNLTQYATISIGPVLTIPGAAAGTPALTINLSATTGAQNASFVAANKPGAAAGSPQKWLPVSLDGTTYYIPAFN
jgi:hypothetical protein